MDVDVAREFIANNSRTVLCTMRADGSPQLSPVNAALDSAGRVVISSRETAFKVRHMRRDPRAWLCVLPDAFYGQWVQVSGQAEILSLPDAMEPLVDYYRRLAGEHPDWSEYRAAMAAEQRCLIRVDIQRAGPDRSG
ncbi:MAG: PPOX class F420-dependent oxidoreductase [Actinomycetota bacterium]|nr:PPOX class F420-dependent oxidoreductase [Actinomycetota bacterium]